MASEQNSQKVEKVEQGLRGEGEGEGEGEGAKRHEEYQYLDLIKRILLEGEVRPDRFVSPKSHFPWEAARTRIFAAALIDC
jgi:hypothetical protein